MKSGLRGGRRAELDASVLFLCKGGRMQAEPERTSGFEMCARAGPRSPGLLAAFGAGSEEGNKGEAQDLSEWDPVNKEWARIGEWVCMKQCGACCFLGASDPPADATIAAQLKDMTARDGWCKHFDKVLLQTPFRAAPSPPHVHLPSCFCSFQPPVFFSFRSFLLGFCPFCRRLSLFFSIVRSFLSPAVFRSVFAHSEISLYYRNHGVAPYTRQGHLFVGRHQSHFGICMEFRPSNSKRSRGAHAARPSLIYMAPSLTSLIGVCLLPVCSLDLHLPLRSNS